jgi:hypothetical protein
MALHSNISPSAAERWVGCPGSVRLCADQPPQPTSFAAAEGTAAHSLCEKLLKKEITKAQLLAMEGSVLKVEKFEIEITEDMIDGAMVFYDTVMGDFETWAKDKSVGITPHILVESRLVARDIDEHVYGTADAILAQGPNRLKVYDFKYGKGKVVEVEENLQMTIYSIGAALALYPNETRTEVEMIIVQPRAFHEDGPVRRWSVSVDYLKKEAARLKIAVAATRDPKAPTIAGSWCRWCAAKAICTAALGNVQSDAKLDFQVIPTPETVPAAMAAMSLEQMAAFLDKWEDALSGMLDAMRVRLKSELEAGAQIPGWKLVSGKSNRKWVDEAKVEADFGALFEVYEKKLLSPAKLEKIVGKGKLDAYTFKPEASKTLARVADPRPAVQTSAQEDFAALLGENDKGTVDELDGLM